MIRYLRRQEIDLEAYDNCIQASLNSRVYAESWYLDCVAHCWGTLVLNDYEAVMPLCWKKKFGIFYVYTPPWVQQLGVFSQKKVDELLIFRFLKAIPQKFKKIDLQLNSSNLFTHSKKRMRNNLLLDLNRSYNDIYQGFNNNRKRALKRLNIVNSGLAIEFIDECVFLDFFNQTPKKYVVTKHMYDALVSLLNSKKGHCMGVYANGELLAVLFFVVTNSRIYYLLPLASQQGLNIGASTFFIDQLIRGYQQKDTFLDFEGSMIEGVASFYKSFGATEERYPVLRYWDW